MPSLPASFLEDSMTPRSSLPSIICGVGHDSVVSCLDRAERGDGMSWPESLDRERPGGQPIERRPHPLEEVLQAAEGCLLAKGDIETKGWSAIAGGASPS